MNYLGIDVGGSSIKHAVMDESYQILSQGTLDGRAEDRAAPAFGRTLATEVDRIYQSTYAQRLGLIAPKLLTCQYRNEANLVGALYHHITSEGRE